MRAWLLVVSFCVSAVAAAEAEDPAWKRSFLISRGGDAYAKGRLPEAEKLFGYVLAIDPTDEQALIYLSAILKRRGQAEKALPLLQRGAAAHPDSFALQFELGAALLGQNKAKDAVGHLEAAVKLKPGSLDAQVNLGDALSLIGQRDVAYEHYRAGVALDGASGWARRQAGSCAFELHRAAEALAHLTVAKATFPDDLGLNLNLGHANAQLGNDAAALEQYQRVTTLAPKSELGPLFTGITFEKLGRLDEAKKQFELAVALKPSSAPARMSLGNMLRAAKQRDAARVQYEAALKAEPQNVWALAQLGFLELELARPARAQLYLFKSYALNPSDADVGVGLGDAYTLQRKTAQAREQYEAVLKRAPTNLAALVKSADAMRTMGDIAEAVRRYAEAARLHPRSAWALISWGDALRLEGKLEEAKVQYAKALALEPESTWAQRQLGFASFELGDVSEARRLLVPLATADSTEPDLLLVVGHLALQREAFDEALGLYERARKLRPQHAPTFLYIADVFQRREQFEQAEVALSQALSLDPTFVDALVLSGDVQRRAASALRPPDPDAAKAKRTRARAAYERALAAAPAHHWARHQLGFVAFELGDDDAARSNLTAVRPTYPADGELVLTLGFIATNRQDTSKAHDLFLEASELLPTDVRPFVFAGRAALALEHLDEADALFASALKVNPESGWAHLERGYAQRLRRDWPRALVSARAATRYTPDQPEAWLFLGRLSQEKRDIETAVSAYEKAGALAPLSANADRALASALTNRGLPADLIRAEGLLVRPLRELGEVGYTHAVAGYAMVKLAATTEANLPAPPGPETRENRKRRWREMGAFELTRALELAPTDRSMRLAAAVSFFELGRYDLALVSAKILVEGGNRVCPTDEWTWKWANPEPLTEQKPALTPDEAAADEDAQLRADAYLLLGELLARDDETVAQSRLAYFCALVWSPRIEGHLRLAASYESMALLRLAEEHFVAATMMDPKSLSAQQGLERLRKEGGLQLGPIRVSGSALSSSDAVPGEVQGRIAAALGSTDKAIDRQLLTTPRTLALEATVSWAPQSWRAKLRFGLGYQFAYGINTFLNDQPLANGQLVYQNRLSHRIEAAAYGRFGEFGDRRYELSWSARYQFTFATSATRTEVRNGLIAGARLLRVDWGSVDAELGYELGFFALTAGMTVSDVRANAGIFALRFSPLIRSWQIELSAGYRGQVVGLGPSGRTVWLHEFFADGRRQWGHIFIGGDLRGGLTSDSATVGGTLASFGIRGSGGYAFTGYSRLFGRAGISLVPAAANFNSVSVGAAGEHRFVFRGVGDADQGLAVQVSYDARISYGLARVEHLVTAIAVIGR